MLISSSPRLLHGLPPGLPRPIRARSLGILSATKSAVRVLVQDRRGHGYPGVKIDITVGENLFYGATNGGGASAIDVEVPPEIKTVTVTAHLPEGSASENIPSEKIDKTVVRFQSVGEAPQPFVTPLEGASAAVGIVIGAAGFIWDVDWLKVLGESLFVVALFSKFARER